MAQEFLVETFVWQPGLKKKEHRFDTLDAAKAFADEEAPHFHIIKVWNENGKNVYTKRTAQTLAQDPDGSHTEWLASAKAFAQKGELNPRFINNAEVLAKIQAQAPNPSYVDPTPNALPMPPEPDLNVPLAPGGEPFSVPDNMPE
jgi:hypothetical protein